MGERAPLTGSIESTVPAAAIAAVQDQVIGEAPYAGEVTGVTVVAEAAVVAHAANYRTLRVINKGQAGAGATVVASLALDTPPGDNLAAFDEKAVPLSGVAGAVDVVAGDVLAVDETVAGDGLAHAGYKVVVEIARG